MEDGVNHRDRADRPPLALWFALLLAGACGPILFAIQDLSHLQGLYLPHAGTLIGRDFTNLYFGGRFAWFDGLNVYRESDYLTALHQVGIRAGQNYSYPPATLAIGAGLSLLPYPFALALWAVGGVACFILAARPHIRFAWPWLLLVPSVAAVPNGQYGLFVSALWLWSFRGSGLAAGVLTLKPHLGVLLAPALLVRRCWKPIAVAVIVTIVLWGGAELLFGLTRAYFEQGSRLQWQILTTPIDEPYFEGMPSTFVQLRHFRLAWPAHLIVAAATLTMLWPLRRVALDRLAFPLATATFLILPYSFGYDTIAVALGFVVLIDQHWGRMTWPERGCALAGYFFGYSMLLAPLFLLLGLWVQRKLLLEDPVVQAAR